MTTKSRILTMLLSAVLWISMHQSAHAFYNPSTGRWLSRDPIGEKNDGGLYCFNSNESIRHFDADGRISITVTKMDEFDCGGFRAILELRLQNSPWPDGYIVQEIQWGVIGADSSGRPDPDLSEGDHYWESMGLIAGSLGPVMPSVKDRSEFTPSLGKNGVGYAKGTARFFPAKLVEDEIKTWLPGDAGGAVGSGTFLSTHTKPTFWDSPQAEPEGVRTIRWEWKCRCPWFYSKVQKN